MKIDLILQCINNDYSWKYRPYEPCCESMSASGQIRLCNGRESEGLTESEMQYEPGVPYPRLAIAERGRNGDGRVDRYHPISFCPFCGEKVTISVVGEEDRSDEYNTLLAEEQNLRLAASGSRDPGKSKDLYEQADAVTRRLGYFRNISEYREA